MEFGSKIMAVLGTSLEAVYPRSNLELLTKSSSGHTVVTQFPKVRGVRPKNFPQRNRIMALVSDARIIVEVPEKSGTIQQAGEAIRRSADYF
jgi:DNA processing protein